jgi:PAS domain S-box-containing protein
MQEDPQKQLPLDKFNLEMMLGVLDCIPAPIYIKDKNMNFVYTNQAYAHVFGHKFEDIAGKNDFDLFDHEAATQFSAVDYGVLKTGIVNTREETVGAADGAVRTVFSRKAKLEIPGSEIFLVGTSTDITEMRKRENQYKALTETVPVGVAQIDETHGITFANPLFNAYCGGDGTEMDQSRMLEKLKQANSVFPAQACKFETVVQGLGNQPRTVIVISSGWLDLGDKTRSATVSLIDISQMTELQRINEEVSRLNRELAENVSNLALAKDELVKRGRMEQLGQLTATVAHELRNPLGAVRTSAFLLERKLKDKGLNVESQLERINKGIVRCDNIITQLLDFSRTKQLNSTPSDIDSWLTGVVEEEVKKLPQNVNVELLLGLDGKSVPFDPGRMERAIINMINNAVEAMVSGGDQLLTSGQEQPKLVISTHEKNGHCSIRIVDNGPGIPDEVLARIREPLFTTKSFGTGLGIPAIEQIAVQHGGRLDIETRVGEGSSFTIWFPIEQAVGEETEKAA